MSDPSRYLKTANHANGVIRTKAEASFIVAAHGGFPVVFAASSQRGAVRNLC